MSAASVAAEMTSPRRRAAALRGCDSEIDHGLPATSNPKASNPASSRTSRVSTVPAALHIISQPTTDSALHSDHSTQIAVNVATVRNASDALHAVERWIWRGRERFISRNAPTTTSAPSRPQNKPSWGSSGNPPRSQHHWYECRSHVAAKTTIVATTSATFVPNRFSLKKLG